MTLERALATIDQHIREATPATAPALVVALSARIAALGAAGMGATHADRWLTVDEACELAQVPERRLRAWARRSGATWASWPTRKTLRIHEGRFLAFLSNAPRLSARNGANRSDRRSAPPTSGPIRIDPSAGSAEADC